MHQTFFSKIRILHGSAKNDLNANCGIPQKYCYRQLKRTSKLTLYRITKTIFSFLTILYSTFCLPYGIIDIRYVWRHINNVEPFPKFIYDVKQYLRTMLYQGTMPNLYGDRALGGMYFNISLQILNNLRFWNIVLS